MKGEICGRVYDVKHWDIDYRVSFNWFTYCDSGAAVDILGPSNRTCSSLDRRLMYKAVQNFLFVAADPISDFSVFWSHGYQEVSMV